MSEASHDRWRGWVEDLVQDLHYALRGFAGNKWFAVTAVVTLALGIGANTAVFSVVSGLVLRPLPFPQPDRLVQVSVTTPLSPQGAGVGGPDLEAFRTQGTSFAAFCAYGVSARYLGGADGSERVMAAGAERGLFTLLGVAPIAGRTFLPDDPLSVAVIGQAFWNERLGGNPSVVGSAITLDGEPFTVIGVMPESFQFPYGAASLLPGVASEARTDLWIPFAQPTRGRPSVVGRLKPNVHLRAAETELTVIVRRQVSQAPETARATGVRLVPLSDVVVGASVRRPLFFLFSAVGIVLALACANVTNLSLVRMTLRRREVAVRAALGASPPRLVRQLLAESLLLSLAGGIVGLGLAKWAIARMMLLAHAQIPRAPEVSFDWPVFVFSAAACTFTGLASGLAPALIARRLDPQPVLQEGGHGTMGVGQRRLRDALVVAEVALAFVLAVGGVLLVRELVRLQQTDTGLVSRNVVTFHIGQRMTPRTDTRQYYEIAERVAQLPGVRAAGFTQLLPLQNWGWTSSSSDFRVRGRPVIPSSPFAVELRYVTPGYFQALGIPIRRGRGFTASDARDRPPVILINEALARRYFPNDDPVGKVTTRGTIVGVVGDVRQVNIDQSAAP
ncbi:MAG: ABC transporter permease, partial [Acidobacteria bacterium]|nr:ABC transporter permease [Acidobacteriota bacterium]